MSEAVHEALLPPTRRANLSGFVFGEKLGAGSYGQVRACKLRSTGAKLAVKIVHLHRKKTLLEHWLAESDSPMSELAGLRHHALVEEELWKDVSGHKYIVKLYESFIKEHFAFFVMERCRCTLLDLLVESAELEDDDLLGFFRSMLMGIEYVHHKGIIHRDVKPDNILINERHNMIKICDFGSGSYINECDITPYLVSRWYRAPEITMCLKYDYSIDLWSIACCLYELYVGKVMFPGNSNNDMLRRFMEVKGRFPNKIVKRSMQKQIELGRPVDFTEDFKFMRIMIDKITKKETVKIVTIEEKPVKDLLKLLQPSTIPADQARKVKQLSDILHGCLMLNPDNRLTLEQCLHHAFIKEPLGYVPKRKVPPPPQMQLAESTGHTTGQTVVVLERESETCG